MGEIVVMIGGMIVLFSALDLMGEDAIQKKWKGYAFRILAGFGVLGVGALLKWFGV